MAIGGASMVAETSTTEGTIAYVLAGVPEDKYQPINASIGTGVPAYFKASMGDDWEIFRGSSSGPTALSRDAILATRVNGASGSTIINWGPGTKTITNILPGEVAVYLDQVNVFAADQDLNGNALILDADADTKIYAATDDTLIVEAGGAEVARITTSGLRVQSTDTGSGIAPSLEIYRNSGSSAADSDNLGALNFTGRNSTPADVTYARVWIEADDVTAATEDATIAMATVRGGSLNARLRIGEHVYTQNSADIYAGKTAASSSTAGAEMRADGTIVATVSGGTCLFVNRLSDDGTLVSLRQASTQEGSISVSGTTVSYNTFLGAHWSQWQRKGMQPPALYSVLVMCQERCGWAEPDYREDPKLPKCDVSRERGAADVYGVFGGLDEDGDVIVWALGTAPGVLAKGPVERGRPLWSSDEPGIAEAAPEDAPWWRCLGRASITDAGTEIRPVPLLVG